MVYNTLDERQINNQNPVIFSDERLMTGIFFLAWMVWAGRLCFLGFGEDTDAWLMAQTAQKLSLGLGYDPARSFGNPLYEFLLSFLQPNQNWIYTNALNLGLAVFFLFRLPLAFPFLHGNSLWFLRLGLLAFPLFTEAATSSMEYMLAWVLFLESLIANQKKAFGLELMLLLLLGFVRMELYFLFLFASQCMEGRKNWIRWIPLAPIAIYLLWAWGKNPSPFSDVGGWFHFSLGRMLFLVRQAGLLTFVYLASLTGLFFLRKEDRFRFMLGVGNLGFFFIFPYEWAYLFPAIFIGGMGWMSILRKKRNYVLPLAILLGSTVSISEEGSLQFSYPGFFTKRKQMVDVYRSAEKFNPSHPTLLLYGATFLPTDTRNWIKSHQNRLFQKSGTQFFVGEKLSVAELDSFRKAGFKIIGMASEKGNLPDSAKVEWLEWKKLIQTLQTNRD